MLTGVTSGADEPVTVITVWTVGDGAATALMPTARAERGYPAAPTSRVSPVSNISKTTLLSSVLLTVQCR